MPPVFKYCQFCQKAFPTQRGVNQHISASIICLNKWHQDIEKKSPKRRRINSPDPNLLDNLPIRYPTPVFDAADIHDNFEDAQDSDHHNDDLATRKRFVETYPGLSGVALRQEKTRFDILEDDQKLEGRHHGNHLKVGMSGSWRIG